MVVIVVNYRTPELVEGCVRSLAADGFVRENARVVVVDNASGDDSVARLEALKREQGPWMDVRACERNGGFAAGNNRVLEEVKGWAEKPEFVWLLNPDTEVEGGALKSLVEMMESRSEMGIAGSKLVDGRGVEQCAAHSFPSPLGELEGMARVGVVSKVLRRWRVSPPQRQEAHACDWVSGASLLARWEVVEEIGMLDAGFFLYFEEVEWCLRARKAGWEVWHVPGSRVKHLEGAATGVRERRRRPAYWFASRRRYFRRAWGVVGWLAADACWLAGWMGYQLKRLLWRGGGEDPKWFARDLVMGDLRALGEKE